MDPAAAAAVGLVVVGLALAWAGATRFGTVGADDVGDYLRDLDAGPQEEVDQYQARLQEPVLRRLLQPLGSATIGRLAATTPRAQLDALHAKLLQAGLAGRLRAEELAVLQLVLAGAGLVGGSLLALLLQPRLSIATCLVLAPPFFGFFGPRGWLDRKVAERKDAIRNDLPDVLDLLAISVEAGSGFEGAVAVVCQDFDSPLSVEMSRMLKEMELGLARREALQNLKRRTEVPELSSFVLAVVQADALGMPIGRVLRTQAIEMRNRRRARAREKAAKLPVKIMVPLVFLIFPAMLVVTVGPAASSLITGLR